MKKKLTSILPFLFLISCLEEYDFKTTDFQSAIVIEATITDELKQQRILLSRTYKFEATAPEYESNAIVEVSDSNGNVYSFFESSPGSYLSIDPFQAIPNVEYTLNVVTSNGRSYQSNSDKLTGHSTIESVTPIRRFDDLNEEHLEILINSNDVNGQSNYYRYQYTETYKIIAPYWSGYDAIIDPDADLGVSTILREQEEQVCYNTKISNNIILYNTLGLNSDAVTDFSIRAIDVDDYIITHRYSIEVKQFVLSPEAYYFYDALKNLSNNESIFSQNQPGFINGNVYSVINNDEKVIGYFDVSSVDSKRIFFNYEDLFPNEPLPPYATNCELSAPELYFYDEGSDDSPLKQAIIGDTMKFFDFNPNPDNGFGYAPYLMIISACGDCTVLGSNIVPDFWED